MFLFQFHMIYRYIIYISILCTLINSYNADANTNLKHNLDIDESFYVPIDFVDHRFHQFGVFVEDISHRKRLNSKFMKELHSQQREDIILFHKIFYGVVNGTFVESGALDGMKFSNTWAFEHALGWTGVNIEGSPSNYKNLNINRPNCVNVHSALCKQYRFVHYAEHSWGEVNGILEYMPDSFVRREMIQPTYKSFTDSNGIFKYSGLDDTKTKVVTIKCQQIHQILDRANITHIDLWSLDVEGSELEVFLGTDFSKIKINVILIEMDVVDNNDQKQIKKILDDNGYILHFKIKNNAVFLHQDFTPSKIREEEK